MTFGVDQLFDGIDIVIVAVGLFAIGEALYMASRSGRPAEEEHADGQRRGAGSAARTCAARGGRGCAARRSASRSARCRPAAPRSRRSCPTRRSAARARKNKEEFGQGAIEGVAGPEAANNAAFSGVLVPLLTLGIPTSATAAVLLAAFQIFDLQPGPQLFENSRTWCGR